MHQVVPTKYTSIKYTFMRQKHRDLNTMLTTAILNREPTTTLSGQTTQMATASCQIYTALLYNNYNIKACIMFGEDTSTALAGVTCDYMEQPSTIHGPQQVAKQHTKHQNKESYPNHTKCLNYFV